MLEEQERKRERGPTLHALCLGWPFLSDWSCPGRDGGPRFCVSPEAAGVGACACDLSSYLILAAVLGGRFCLLFPLYRFQQM